MQTIIYIIQFLHLDGEVEQMEFNSEEAAREAFEQFRADEGSADIYAHAELYSYNFSDDAELFIDTCTF